MDMKFKVMDNVKQMIAFTVDLLAQAVLELAVGDLELALRK